MCCCGSYLSVEVVRKLYTASRVPIASFIIYLINIYFLVVRMEQSIGNQLYDTTTVLRLHLGWPDAA